MTLPTNIDGRIKVKKISFSSIVSPRQCAQEYRGQRSAESLATFIKDQLKECVQVKESTDDLIEANKEKSAVIAYMEKADSANFAIFQRMARSLRDECNFFAVFGYERGDIVRLTND